MRSNPSLLLVTTLVTMASVGTAMAAAAMPETPASTAEYHAGDGAADAARSSADLDAAKADADSVKADMDKQLAQAREQLAEAARQVAEISAKMAGPYMNEFMAFGDGPHAVIGVQLDAHSGKDGARVQEVSPGGPAAEVGMHVGDVIVAVNGNDVKGERPARNVLHQMAKVEPDGKVKLTVIRDGKPHEFMVTARAGAGYPTAMHVPVPPVPPLPPMPMAGPRGRFDSRDMDFGPIVIRGPLARLELVSLTPQLGTYFGTDKGVLVIRAPQEDGFKLEEGDVILSIDGREPASGAHATRILGSYQAGEKISMKVMRQHKTLNIETSLPEGRGPGPRAEGSDRKVRLIRRDSSSSTT